MDSCFEKLEYTDEKKVIAYCKSIIKAVELTRDVAMKSKMKSKKAYDAIDSGDKQMMWNVLQEYLHNYPKLTATAYGVYICRVDANFYDSITEDDISEQLKIVIALIYLNEAQKSVAHEKIKSCLKKILKQSKVFSDKEIELLLL